jgi:hypothetical protein
MTTCLGILSLSTKSIYQNRKPPLVKSRKSKIQSRVHAIPELRFEKDQELTPYAGAVLYQALFQKLSLKDKLCQCFGHIGGQKIFGAPTVVLLLIMHLVLGYRRLRGLNYYREDPLIARVIGVRKLPDISTASRTLTEVDFGGVINLRALCRELVLDRLSTECCPRITIDFDGSVLSTKRHAEGSAVGYNKKKKGARSYYPLFCTVSQTGQALDVYHRSGNVHDSRGAMLFMRHCIIEVKKKLPKAVIEVRIDGAFFSERLLKHLDRMGVLFSASVPFERLAELKEIIETRTRWEALDPQWSSFEANWKPASWKTAFRFVVSRQQVKKQDKKPIQLELFEPRAQDSRSEYEYDYRVIVTNHTMSCHSVIRFHHGRGCQEQVFAELKTMANMDTVPFKRLISNEVYVLSAILAHNLTRELQMQAKEKVSGTTQKRNTLWQFETLSTIRQNLVHRAGILKRPQGKLTLVMNANPTVETEFNTYIDALKSVA